jgi:antitoxin CptB
LLEDLPQGFESGEGDRRNQEDDGGTSGLNLEEGRLRWLLRRGMKELDVVMARYYERRYPSAPAAERAAFLRLITQVEDPEIWAWTVGSSETPDEFADVITELRRHH